MDELIAAIAQTAAERRADFRELERTLSLDSLLYRSLPSPLHIRELASLINLENIQDVDNEQEVARRLGVVEARLLNMASVMEAFKEMRDEG